MESQNCGMKSLARPLCGEYGFVKVALKFAKEG